MTRNDKLTLAGLGLGVAAILIVGTVLWARPVLKARAEKAAAVAAEAARKSAALAREQAERNSKFSRIMAERESQRAHAAAAIAATKAAKNRELAGPNPWVENDWILVGTTDSKRDRLGGMTITGILKSNAAKRTLRHLTIRFSIYDQSDNKVDDAADYIASLGPGETWAFEAGSLRKHGSYKLESVKCSDGRLD
ncbi:MAG: FxLYD domain-containing protein [Chthoniobacteraceae bacterium]|nr:FxLYD domain-containing protein [Chthoniobacteraceae bacterium]